MRLSKSLMNALQQLIEGKQIASSLLNKQLANELLSERLLTVYANGSKRKYCAINPLALKNFLSTRYEALRDFDTAKAIINEVEISRSQQAKMTGNSKLIAVRSCPGFAVNAYTPIKCRLNNSDVTINPPDGTFMFITDWKAFCIPTDVIVIGIENMENFRQIRHQRLFFEKYLSKIYQFSDKPDILFVSRYPQSTDLRLWLQTIPNKYIHFGDFDLAGINIYLNEFHKHLGDRSSFLIPSDIERRIANGSTTRYNDQYAKFQNISTDIQSLQDLIVLIHKYHRCYDQEGYIT